MIAIGGYHASIGKTPLNDLGQNSDYWSSFADSYSGGSNYVYNLLFNNSGVYSSSRNYRFCGFSLRCLAS